MTPSNYQQNICSDAAQPNVINPSNNPLFIHEPDNAVFQGYFVAISKCFFKVLILKMMSEILGSYISWDNCWIEESPRHETLNNSEKVFEKLKIEAMHYIDSWNKYIMILDFLLLRKLFSFNINKGNPTFNV